MDEIIELENLNLEGLSSHIPEIFHLRKIFKEKIMAEPDYLKINKKKLKEYIHYLQKKYNHKNLISETLS